MDIKYEDTVAINPVKTAVWVVHFQEPEETQITVFGVDVPIENVVQYIKNKYPGRKFKVGSVSAGEFLVQSTISYYGNGRMVNQDGYMVLG